MTQIVFEKLLQDGIDTALGSDVMHNLGKIVTVIHGQLENENISPSAAISGSKLADATITNTQMAPNAIHTDQILNANVTAIKMADDGTIQGDGCNLNELFTEQDQTYAIPAQTGGKKQHGGKTIWAYFVAGVASTTYRIDDATESLDWRYRLIDIHMVAYNHGTPSNYLPGGTPGFFQNHSLEDGGGSWAVQAAATPSPAISAIFWSGGGSTPSSVEADSPDGPNTYISYGVGSTSEYGYWYVDNTVTSAGDLMFTTNAITADPFAILARITCSPVIKS